MAGSPVEAASRRGNHRGAVSYGSIASILKYGLEKAFAIEPTPDTPPIWHGNTHPAASLTLQTLMVQCFYAQRRLKSHADAYAGMRTARSVSDR